MEWSYPEGKRFNWRCFLFGCKQRRLGFCERGCGRFTHTTGYGLYVNYIPELHSHFEDTICLGLPFCSCGRKAGQSHRGPV